MSFKKEHKDVIKRILRKIRKGKDRCRSVQIHYPVEINNDGYAKIRYTIPGDYVKDKQGKARMREFKPGKFRKDLTKYGMFLHHAIFYKKHGRKPHKDWEISHLCGNPLCTRKSHIICEPGAVNRSRRFCCREYCIHKVKCKRTLKELQERMRKQCIGFEDHLVNV